MSDPRPLIEIRAVLRRGRLEKRLGWSVEHQPGATPETIAADIDEAFRRLRADIERELRTK